MTHRRPSLSSLARRGTSLALALIMAGCGTTGSTPAVPSRTPAASSATPPPPTPAPTPTPPPETLDPEAIGLDLEVVVGGLDAPVGVTNAHDGSGRLFVIEQGGTVRVIRDGTLVARPFLDLAARITAGGERGLLGLAFHPSGDGRLYVDYTDLQGDTVIAEFSPTADGDAADPDSERILLTIDQPYPNHNGGAVVFGPDGHLYIAMGDGGAGGDPEDRAERLDTLLGKILRIAVEPEGDRPYGIPADNPYLQMSGALPEIAHAGLRNPWRMQFDRATGDLWIGDVGQSAFEELDVARSGQLGLDFGWDRFEGRSCFEPPQGCDPTGFTMPVVEYPHDFGCSVVGGPVARDGAPAALQGIALYADVCSGIVFGAVAAGPDEQDPVVLLRSERRLASFGEGEDGQVYVVDLGGGDLLRVTAAG